MPSTHANNYLGNIRKLFRYYKSLGDGAIAQLKDDEVNAKPESHSNSIAIIVKHMSGNMLSRWTNFLEEDGEKEWRHRDQEFEETIHNKTDLISTWEKGWACLFKAIDPLTEADLDRIGYIRNEGHSVIEAINRQLGHYAYHTGQIVFLVKLLRSEDWASLSIPKGQSKAFNQEKFNKEKSRKNFI